MAPHIKVWVKTGRKESPFQGEAKGSRRMVAGRERDAKQKGALGGLATLSAN